MVDPILLSIFSFVSVFVFGSHVAYRTRCCGNDFDIENRENEIDIDVKRNDKELLHIEYSKEREDQEVSKTIIPFSSDIIDPIKETTIVDNVKDVQQVLISPIKKNIYDYLYSFLVYFFVSTFRNLFNKKLE